MIAIVKKKENAKSQVAQAHPRKSPTEKAAEVTGKQKLVRISGRLVRRPETRNAGGQPHSPVREIDPTCDTKPIRVDGAGRIFGQKPIPEDVRQMFTKLVPQCIAVLADLMYNAEKDKDRIAAATAIIAYGYGKPETVTRVHMDVQGLKRDQVAEVVRAELCNQAAEQAAKATQSAIEASHEPDAGDNAAVITAELA